MKLPFTSPFEMQLIAPLSTSIDKKLNLLLTNPDFLKTASVVINLNSYRRKWTRATVRRVLTSLELPVRTDQEKMLALLEQLNDRIEDLEAATQGQGAETALRKKKLDVVGRVNASS
jgi:hypothetical protein